MFLVSASADWVRDKESGRSHSHHHLIFKCSKSRARLMFDIRFLEVVADEYLEGSTRDGTRPTAQACA